MSEIKYSKEQFDDYTHRFMVHFTVNDDYVSGGAITLYSNCDKFDKLEEFINEKKSEKVKSFEIVHRASKEQDEASGRLIDELLDRL